MGSGGHMLILTGRTKVSAGVTPGASHPEEHAKSGAPSTHKEANHPRAGRTQKSQEGKPIGDLKPTLHAPD
jgi:hypothetical protein